MSEIVDIDEALLARMPLPEVDPEGDKKERGSLLVIAGGAAVPGAAILSGVAGLRAGAGRLALAVPDLLAIAIGLQVPEARIHALPATHAGEAAASAPDDLREACRTSDAVVIGPGMIDEVAAAALALDVAAERPKAIVIDAGALTGLAAKRTDLRLDDTPSILTPHAGELATLMDWPVERIEAAPHTAAKETADAFGATIILKGATTHIATPDGKLLRLRVACPGLATSGSGDVLAGLIGGLLAQGASPLTSAVWGVYVHAHVGQRLSTEIGPVGFLAREMADAIAASMRNLAKSLKRSS
jgi:ADP-dependent NAD(P)H-hydrate dehydratase